MLAPPMFKHKLLDVQYSQTREHTFWGHLDPARLCVPRYVKPNEDMITISNIYRYQNIFRITIWLFFLVVYSQAG